LILLAEEREAVAAIKVQSSVETEAQNRVLTVEYRIKTEERKIVDGTCPFTDYEKDNFQLIGNVSHVFADPVTTQNHSGTFMLRGTGGFSYQVALSFTPDGSISNPGFADFQRYNSGSKETANSSLGFMRGGLFYDEPTLSPRNQKGNRWYTFDTITLTEGGFEQLNNRTPIGFVGEV
jgi:hypothetical protein